jgi:antagonist of KipI
LSLLVVKPGLFSTVQDRGRAGYRGWGVPVGGAFDVRAYELANALVGNAPEAGAAAVELTLRGGTFEATAELACALAGAVFEAWIEGPSGAQPLRPPRSFCLRAGERLVLGNAVEGVRAYLAAAGGFRLPVVLGSRSREVALRVGEELPAAPGRIAMRSPGPGLLPTGAGPGPIRVVDGPDALALGEAPGSAWAALSARVGPQSDRMGLRLEGARLAVPAEPDRVSTPVAPGAVQVAGEGLIVLGVACGTMGGYPHVGHVIAADLPRLAQARPGDRITFERVEIADARAIDARDRLDRARALRLIAAAARDAMD